MAGEKCFKFVAGQYYSTNDKLCIFSLSFPDYHLRIEEVDIWSLEAFNA
jgi:hypothetical protein